MKPAFHRRAFWSFAGLFLLGFAGWEAVQLSSGSRKAFADVLLPPPLRSRSGERPLLVREKETGDPVANYLARAKRGMTEQEVRWMLEDFEAEGLDRIGEVPRDLPMATALRKKLEAWYLAALSDGLSLTPAQKEDAKLKMEALFTHDLQAWEQFSPEERRSPLFHFRENEDVFKSVIRMGCLKETLFSDQAFAPWNLVQLTEQQGALTLRFWRLIDSAEPDDWLYTVMGREFDPFSESNQSTLLPMPGLPAIQDPLTGNLTEFPGDPPLVLMTPKGRRLYAYLPCGNVLPLTPDQKPLWEKSYDLAAQALLCQPAQLRLALLRQPELAKTLREELDLEPSQRGLQLSPKAAAAPSPE